jgi:hypothetical protein
MATEIPSAQKLTKLYNNMDRQKCDKLIAFLNTELKHQYNSLVQGVLPPIKHYKFDVINKECVNRIKKEYSGNDSIKCIFREDEFVKCTEVKQPDNVTIQLKKKDDNNVNFVLNFDGVLYWSIPYNGPKRKSTYDSCD